MKEIAYEKPESAKKETVWEKKKKPVQSSLATVRTFRADVQELIKEKGTTLTDVAMAEAARRESRGETRFPIEETNVHLGRIILILVFVLAFGLGVGGYALFGGNIGGFFGKVATSTAPVPTTDDLKVDISNSPREQVLADISIAFGKTYLPTGEKRAIVFVTNDESGDIRSATKEEFFTAVSNAKLPDQLLLSLDSRFSYQVYSSSTLSGVITLGSRSYPNTFAAMLDWEPEMAGIFIPVLDPFYNRKLILSLRERKFKDEQGWGVGIRTLSDLDGIPVLSYGFIDKRTLVIAGKPDSIHAIISANTQNK